MLEVNNMPSYAYDYEYIVASLCDGEMWFYGVYHNKDDAMREATRNGCTFRAILRNSRFG